MDMEEIENKRKAIAVAVKEDADGVVGGHLRWSSNSKSSSSCYK